MNDQSMRLANSQYSSPYSQQTPTVKIRSKSNKESPAPERPRSNRMKNVEMNGNVHIMKNPYDFSDKKHNAVVPDKRNRLNMTFHNLGKSRDKVHQKVAAEMFKSKETPPKKIVSAKKPSDRNDKYIFYHHQVLKRREDNHKSSIEYSSNYSSTRQPSSRVGEEQSSSIENKPMSRPILDALNDPKNFTGTNFAARNLPYLANGSSKVSSKKPVYASQNNSFEASEEFSHLRKLEENAASHRPKVNLSKEIEQAKKHKRGLSMGQTPLQDSGYESVKNSFSRDSSFNHQPNPPKKDEQSFYLHNHRHYVNDNGSSLLNDSSRTIQKNEPSSNRNSRKNSAQHGGSSSNQGSSLNAKDIQRQLEQSIEVQEHQQQKMMEQKRQEQQQQKLLQQNSSHTAQFKQQQLEKQQQLKQQQQQQQLLEQQKQQQQLQLQQQQQQQNNHHHHHHHQQQQANHHYQDTEDYYANFLHTNQLTFDFEKLIISQKSKMVKDQQQQQLEQQIKAQQSTNNTSNHGNLQGSTSASNTANTRPESSGKRRNLHQRTASVGCDPVEMSYNKWLSKRASAGDNPLLSRDNSDLIAFLKMDQLAMAKQTAHLADEVLNSAVVNHSKSAAKN